MRKFSAREINDFFKLASPTEAEVKEVMMSIFHKVEKAEKLKSIEVYYFCHFIDSNREINHQNIDFLRKKLSL
ncbi:MAG: hypothetical protein ABIN24_08845, partial [Dyadobacter sp.]